uniref:RNA polymerase sigma-70 domain-containing protein n=1 Tax=Helicotheca tamesis TaxID=374047 RepID=A0A7S2N3W2_9STRA|mmetsp:Transcript_8946/g.12386  ORF Transcript_8946/g.12386 Transcript_8946/m.12386 type:complete len:411 (+) Transcript_8946:144-1376(+)|eukprot:CAMPEP_0185735760 /NCGR_PEP_ID=MMETSP1171-20130828/26151_1 /TAXON_ID=374046 /ORGANISM="Helicotheca tamensis, Strain CCMP826" /LENGTH=410 /DNA_ID=CAMNT_0028406175 /DNA_START=104 /DNA_END=1336 /DNA_ORIENTATION=+
MIIATLLVSLLGGASSFGSCTRCVASIRRRSFYLQESKGEVTEGVYSFIDDGKGHINAALAQSIFEWDSAHRREGDGDGEAPLTKNTPKFKYSTRAGLRLVDSIAREIISETSDGSASSTASSSASAKEDSAAANYADLAQEGVVALMNAMATFDEALSEDFSTYAKRHIYTAMSSSLATASRPIRLPRKIHETLRHARAVQDRLRSSLSREPTVPEIAQQLPADVTPDKLQLYMLVGRGTLSVESTVEIYNPANNEPSFADEDQYEAEHGRIEAHLHSGEDDLYNDLEEEEEWVEHDKIVAPLRDFIPDTSSPTPDDFALTHMIRHDIDDLLQRTLNEREQEVIRMRFGLTDFGREEGLTLTDIGSRLGVSRQRIAQIERSALDKLRNSYQSTIVEKYLDDDHAEEVSV